MRKLRERHLMEGYTGDDPQRLGSTLEMLINSLTGRADRLGLVVHFSTMKMEMTECEADEFWETKAGLKVIVTAEVTEREGRRHDAQQQAANR